MPCHMYSKYKFSLTGIIVIFHGNKFWLLYLKIKRRSSKSCANKINLDNVEWEYIMLCDMIDAWSVSVYQDATVGCVPIFTTKPKKNLYMNSDAFLKIHCA